MLTFIQLLKFALDYCRIDYNFEANGYDNMINDDYCDIANYVYMAIEYIKNATGVVYEDVTEDSYLYKLAVAMLVNSWYENRVVTTSEHNTPLKYSLSYILLQLKLCYGGGK